MSLSVYLYLLVYDCTVHCMYIVYCILYSVYKFSDAAKSASAVEGGVGGGGGLPHNLPFPLFAFHNCSLPPLTPPGRVGKFYRASKLRQKT